LPPGISFSWIPPVFVCRIVKIYHRAHREGIEYREKAPL
jgi:hypothetical protein